MGLFKRLKKYFAGKKRDSGELRGKRYEKRVVRRLKRKGVNVVAQGRRFDYMGKKKEVEVDIETPNTSIEIKSGNTRNLEEKLKRYKSVLPNKEPLAYAPKIKDQFFKKLKKGRFLVFKDFTSLTNHLYNKGEFTSKGSKKYRRNQQRRHK